MRDDAAYILRRCGYRLQGNSLDVAFAGGRKQTITVDEAEGVLRFTSLVASRTAVQRYGEGALQLLLQNRLTELVEFTVDRKGRWVAQTVIPPGPVDIAEVREHVRALATAADRLEQVVTGKDTY